MRENLPDILFDVQWLDIALWQWLALLALVLVAFIGGFVIGWGLARVLRTIWTRIVEYDKPVAETALPTGFFMAPLRLGAAVAVFYAASFFLGLPILVQERIGGICKALIVVAFAWLILRLIDLFADIGKERFAEKDPTAARTIIPMGRRVAKIFVVALAAVALFDNLGFNVAGLLAGLGVGGLAVALAAQKTLENVFGGFTVIADRPATVGDFCRVGDHIGTVEEIGLRSTRVRTLDRTLVTIPNAEFSTARIENFAARDSIRLHAVLGVGYDTSPDQMRYLLVEVRKMLYAHPRTLPDPCRIRFINFGAYSLDLELFLFIDTQDWNDFLCVREDIYLRIMDIVESSGAYFAYPSQTLYVARDTGRNMAKTSEAEEAVRGWRDADEMLIPEFPPE
ncbi:MAG: mechanosensitive ion channel family protein, partial [Planctomycetota bacterium]